MKKYLMAITLMLVLNGCGGSESSETPIDMAEYLPSNSLNKQYTDVVKLNGNLINSAYVNSITVEPNMITTKRDGLLKNITMITNDEVNVLSVGDINQSKIYKRKVYLGNEVSNYLSINESRDLKVGLQKVGEEHIQVVESCTFDTRMNEYEYYYYLYKNYDGEHDIIKLKCTSNKTVNTIVDAQYSDTVSYKNGTVTSKDNISYIYLQKGLGIVATIDNDCIVNKLENIIDDTVDKSMCIGEQYHNVLYHPEY